MTRRQHILLLPYYSREEVERFKDLARVLRSWAKPAKFDIVCIVCSVVTGLDDDDSLVRAFSQWTPTTMLRCSSLVLGYPQRPSAMFWETMEHVAQHDNGDGGFVLWLESDMVPTRPEWLAKLDEEWAAHQSPLVMGLVFRAAYIRATNELIPQHINGGACYAKSYASHVAPLKRSAPFDIMPFRRAMPNRQYVATKLFRFATCVGIVEEMSEEAVVLHAYRQDKAEFFSAWRRIIVGDLQFSQNDVKRTCCDLHTRHMLITYCPIHSIPTIPIKMVNLISVLAFRLVAGLWRRIKTRFGDIPGP